MPKQTIEVDIPQGYEFSFCRPGPNKEVFEVVLQKPWQVPDFLRTGWLAMEANGEWCWSEREPIIAASNPHIWEFWGKTLSMRGCNWTPPPYRDWKESKRRVP